MGEAKRKREGMFKTGVTYVRPTPQIKAYVAAIKPDEGDGGMQIVPISERYGTGNCGARAVFAVSEADELGWKVYFCCVDAHDAGVAPWEHPTTCDYVSRIVSHLLKVVGKETFHRVLSKHSAELIVKCGLAHLDAMEAAEQAAI